MENNKTAIIGVGLLGGSLALALRRKGKKVVGWNHRASSRRRARKLLPVARSLEEAVQGAGTVLLCAHSGSIGTFLRSLLPLLPKGCLIMDVSSIKGSLAQEASRIPGASRTFLPCHPMAGKELSGPENADPDLYRGRVVFLTPLPGTPISLKRRAVAFWGSVGARVVVLSPSSHDRIVALTSHLPHLLACAMMELFGTRRRGDRHLVEGVGTGFRDFTRIAGGSPSMWNDIMRLNAKEILSALRAYRSILFRAEKRLARGRSADWWDFFDSARAQREKL